MRKIFVSLVAASMLWSSAKADEGKWLPMLIKRLNYTDMQAKGLQLTAEEIYSVNNSSLKDAIVSFGGFCTAEVISGEGLMLTNHHCGYDAIQSNSTTEKNILRDGFWAYNKEQELPNEGLTAAFLVKMDDVTNRVIAELNGNMTEAQRKAKVQEISQKIVKEMTEGTSYNARVAEFFNGNEYYVFVYETFKDVRLVGAPAEAIGKFGGDTDNWMWPRHTGDFSFFRVYANKDNKPATYSKDNVPYKPKHFLPINISGTKPGDYAMIMGYPGRTDRFLTSYGVTSELELRQPAIVKIRDLKLALMKQDMDANPAVRLKYSSKYANIANYWKYFIGQQKQLKRNKVYDKKLKLEQDFVAWYSANADRKSKYAESLDLIKTGIEANNNTVLARTYLNEAGIQSSEALNIALQAGRALKPAMGDAKALAAAKVRIEEVAKEIYKDYNLATDKKVFAAMLELAYNNIPKKQQPAFFENIINKKFKGDFKAFAEKAFATSVFVDETKLSAFLSKPDQKILDKDYLYLLANEIVDKFTEFNKEVAANNEKLDKGKRLFVAGLREMLPNQKFSPDANSTMRLTYGSVLDYKGADAVKYDYMTTLDGVMEKEDPSVDEFIVPAKLKELWSKKDYGQYANADGSMPVCFLTNNDITGGNSGSPTINAKGELIGTAFDGNWEAMSGDIAFEPNLQRTIVCDIRFVLFIVDKYAGAKNLINEMKLVTTPAPSTTSAIEPTAPVMPAKPISKSAKKG